MPSWKLHRANSASFTKHDYTSMRSPESPECDHPDSFVDLRSSTLHFWDLWNYAMQLAKTEKLGNTMSLHWTDPGQPTYKSAWEEFLF